MQASSKYCLAKAPKLVEIMNAVPEEFKSILIPQYGLPQTCALRLWMLQLVGLQLATCHAHFALTLQNIQLPLPALQSTRDPFRCSAFCEGAV